jgi:hypothetical protein
MSPKGRNSLLFKTLKPNNMRKIIIITLLVIANSVSAQNKKVIKNVNVGAILATVASTSFEGGSKPFTLGYNISASAAFVTKKTVHNFMYSFGGNSVAMLNAYFLPKNWDVYAVGAKSLNSKGGYLGIGIEKLEKVGRVKFFEFCELGTSFHCHPSLTLGILTNLSWSLKKRIVKMGK